MTKTLPSQMRCAVFSLSLLFFSMDLSAATSEECSQEALMANFPPDIVLETLDHFDVPKDQREAIKTELIQQDKDFIERLETKASKMHPNPFQDPQQRQTAVKIFREMLYDSFAGVMKSHGVTDEKNIQSMLDNIQQEKAKQFAKCIEMQKNSDNEDQLEDSHSGD